MVVFQKIFMKFESVFWDNCNSIYIANENQGYYPWFKPVKGTNLMIAIVTGEEAKRVERLDDE
jgi:hypothetical protein